MRRTGIVILGTFGIGLVGGLAWALVYLRGIDPNVAREIEARRSQQTCDVTLHRIGRALQTWSRAHGAYPESLDELARAGLLEPPFDRACPLDPRSRSGEWGYRIVKGARPPFPGGAILYYETAPNHQVLDRRGELSGNNRVVTGDFRLFWLAEDVLARMIADEESALAQVAAAGPGDLVKIVGEKAAEQRFGLALAAQELARRDLDLGAKREAVAGIDLARGRMPSAPGWLEIELALALARLDPEAGVVALVDLVAGLDRPGVLSINYFGKVRAVEGIHAGLSEDRRAAYAREAGVGSDLGLDPLDSKQRLAEAARRLAVWLGSRG